ncbi:MAG: hypothetical protein ACRC1H_20600, partial [Caldilineaceae bacterium]
LLAAFTLLSTAALATHYNTLFILVAWYAWWGIRCLLQPDRWRRLLAPLACGLTMTLLLSPLASIALRQIPGYANPNLTVPSVPAYLIANVQGHLAGYAWDPNRLFGMAAWWLWGAVVLVAIGLVLGVVAGRSQYSSLERNASTQALLFLLVWLFGGLTLYYVAVLDRGAFNVRYSAFVTPALFALIGVGIAGWQRFWLPVLLIVAVGLPTFVQADLYDSRFDREDIAGVTQWLRDETRPGDVIFVDQKYPFGFYYDRYSIDTEETPSGSEAAPARYLFVDINTLDSRLNEWAANAERVFWVQWFESDTDPRHAVPFLLSRNGRLEGEEIFQGWRINWWQLSPPSAFATAPDLQPYRVQVPPVETVEVSLPATASVAMPPPVAIRWQLVQGREPGPLAQRPLKARVALYDAANNRVAQADERLLNDRHLAPAEWAAADQPLNVYLPAPTSETPLAPGAYTVRLLVYDTETLEPLTMLDEAGNPAGIETNLGTVTLE